MMCPAYVSEGDEMIMMTNVERNAQTRTSVIRIGGESARKTRMGLIFRNCISICRTGLVRFGIDHRFPGLVAFLKG